MSIFKRKASSELKKGDPQAKSLNPIYRQLRMLERRTADLEETTRTQRLALNRIERAESRGRHPQILGDAAAKESPKSYRNEILRELGLMGGNE